jgi:hypothetical protein
MSRTGTPACGFPTGRNEWCGLGGWAHDYRFAGLLRSEAQGNQGRTEKARDRHSECKQSHRYRRDDHDVSEAAQTYMLPERRRACRSHCGDDLAPLLLDYFLLFGQSRTFGVVNQRVIRILNPKPLGNPLELLPCRVSRREVRPYVPEQAGHLAIYVVGWCEVEEMSLCSIEVAYRTFDKRPIAEETVPEPFLRLQLLRTSRLPGRIKMEANGAR